MNVQKTIAFLRANPQIPIWASVGWSFAYGVFNGILGLAFQSWWFATLAILYWILALARLSVICLKRVKDDAILKVNGGIVLFIAVIIAGMTYQAIAERINPMRGLIVMIAMAAYTFWMSGVAVYNAVRAHKDRSARLIALRNIACANMVCSMLSLERGMLGTFGEGRYGMYAIMESLTGAGAFVLLVALGLNMIRMSKRYR